MKRVMGSFLSLAFGIVSLGPLTTASVAAAAPTELPRSLICKGVAFASGDVRQSLQPYEELEISGIGSVAGPLYEERRGSVTVEANNKVIVSFNDGDQFLSFAFVVDDVEKFRSGKIPVLPGIMEQGFEWDRYYTQTMLVVHCKS